MNEQDTAPESGPEPRAVVLLTADEVAAMLNLKSARSVYKLARRHNWGFVRTLGQRVRYDRRGLLQWIKRRPKRRERPQRQLDGVHASLHTYVEGGPTDAQG